MNKNIGIIVAETEEMIAIEKIMKNIIEIKIYDLTFKKGNIGEKECILVKGGVGKVNAARTTQILTDKFDTQYIINIGAAGALNEQLDIGDVVIGKELIQHDFDVTAFGHEKGYISDTGRVFKSNQELIDKCKKVHLKNNKIIEGIITTGDIFCTDIKMKENIKNKFNCDCVEMEGAAIAQVCFLNKVPFIVIRSISDSPNGKNQIDFKEYLKIASKNCSEFIEQILV